ncbi:MAG: imidazolonepropionase [Vicinamibacterales bacterium]
MPVLRDIGRLVTPERGVRQGVLREVSDAALAWRNGIITWVGPRSLLPSSHDDGEHVSAGGGLVIPGLVDCHTHLAFAGWRADEFVQRIGGRSYEDIARSGGGIRRTVAATVSCSSEVLAAHCVSELRAMALLGVTTVECKSGYGGTVHDELRLLDIYRDVASLQPLRLVPTLLAHGVPEAYEDRRADYLGLVTGEMIPRAAAARLARFVDVFVEATAFSVGEGRVVLEAAQAAGLGAKLHADQLHASGGTELAAKLRAVSADHLDSVGPSGIDALAKSGTVAVSLPIATLYVGTPPMPARACLGAGVPVAVATDFNPGTAPAPHLPLAMLLACTLQHMTPAEVLCGVTHAAAAALAAQDAIGVLEAGWCADFAIIDAPSVDQWVYHFSGNACRETWRDGRRLVLN